MADFSPPLLAANDLSGLGRLAQVYREGAMRDELARYMHDKLSAADSARARAAHAEIQSRERVGMAPWDRGITPSEVARNQLFQNQVSGNLGIDTERNKLFRDELAGQERGQALNLILGALSRNAETPEDAINFRALNDAALKDATDANMEREALATAWVKDTPPDIYKLATGTEKKGRSLFDWTANNITPAQAAKTATDITKAKYGDRVSLDAVTGRFVPVPQARKPRTDIQSLAPFINALFPGNEQLKNLFGLNQPVVQAAPVAPIVAAPQVAARAVVGPDGKLRFIGAPQTPSRASFLNAPAPISATVYPTVPGPSQLFP